MTPAARVQTAIEVLDAVIAAARAQGASADNIIADLFRQRRYMGSGDRRAVRDLAFGAIRACGPVPVSGRAAMLRLAMDDPALAALFDGSRHGPVPIDPEEPVAQGGLAPVWLEQRLTQSGIAPARWQALLTRASLDIRLNPLRGAAQLPLPGDPLPVPGGLRYPPGTPVEQWAAYKDGSIDVQDAGSQIACLVVGAAAGETVIDLCAGAGGKSLALAAAMNNRGRIVACDVDRRRLARLAPRAERAGVSIVTQRLLDPKREGEALADLMGAADAVLIDAPCSATGTWRRNPEARWRLNEAELARLTAIQSRLLDVGAGLVKPGGRMVFVTCSLLDEEGRHQAEGFVQRHPAWRPALPSLPVGTAHGPGLRLEPAIDGTDGFFIACFAAPC